MKRANIAELKNRLSAYLDYVREGEEILVLDRKSPIARIVPLSDRDHGDPDLAALVASGQARPPRSRPSANFWSAFWALPAPRVSLKQAVDAVVRDRDESA